MRDQRLAIAIAVIVVLALILTIDLTQHSWVDIGEGIGGWTTAAALIFVGLAFFQTRKQTHLMQQSIGRAWIGGGTDPLTQCKIAIRVDRLILYCKNYGQLPARVSGIRSAINESQLTKLQLRSAQENPLKQIIFPDNQGDFTTIQKVDIKSHEDKTIWIGFIVRYEATSESVGEYGIIGTYVSSQVGAAYFKQTDEWFEPSRDEYQ
jgi:hypothetical protein